jgi:hypothetical protein
MARAEFVDRCEGRIRADDWPIIGKIVSILKIFIEITEQLSHASACISEVTISDPPKCCLENCGLLITHFLLFSSFLRADNHSLIIYLLLLLWWAKP